jgi:hypothetical protein
MQVHTTVMVLADRLIPSTYNPNVLPPEEYAALKASIRLDGFVEPVVVQKANGKHTIIGGHHRVRAVLEICNEEGAKVPRIPCVVLEIDDAHAKRLNLKLQHIHGSPDSRVLGELLVDIYRERAPEPHDVALLGLAFEDACRYMQIAEPDFFPQPEASGGVSEFGKSITLSIEFSDVPARDRVKKMLLERSKMEHSKPGDVISKLLFGAKRKITILPPAPEAS